MEDYETHKEHQIHCLGSPDSFGIFFPLRFVEDSKCFDVCCNQRAKLPFLCKQFTYPATSEKHKHIHAVTLSLTGISTHG